MVRDVQGHSGQKNRRRAGLRPSESETQKRGRQGEGPYEKQVPEADRVREEVSLCKVVCDVLVESKGRGRKKVTSLGREGRSEDCRTEKDREGILTCTRIVPDYERETLIGPQGSHGTVPTSNIHFVIIKCSVTVDHLVDPGRNSISENYGDC